MYFSAILAATTAVTVGVSAVPVAPVEPATTALSTTNTIAVEPNDLEWLLPSKPEWPFSVPSPTYPIDTLDNIPANLRPLIDAIVAADNAEAVEASMEGTNHLVARMRTHYCYYACWDPRVEGMEIICEFCRHEWESID